MPVMFETAQRPTISQNTKSLTFTKIFLSVLLILLLFNSVVFPNSFQILNAGVLGCLAIILLFRQGLLVSVRTLLLFLCLNMVTVLYIFVGSINGAPNVALLQIVIIYIISPIIWVIVLDWLLKEFSYNTIFVIFAIMTILACATVAVFFILAQKYGPAALMIFNTAGNVNIDEGFSAATMHVFGSLIFLGAAFFSAPSVISNLLLRYSVLVALPITALASGRSAFVVALAIGAICFIFASKAKNILFNIIFGAMCALLIILISTWAMQAFLGVDAIAVLKGHYEKILLSGGEERVLQNAALLNGIVDANFLGNGHGVGVSFKRSDDMPWRYEAVLLATIFRVGLLGFIIYAIPFVISLFIFFRRIILMKVTNVDRFFGGGLLASLVSANTNPYIEGFTFQWMYFLPLVYFIANANVRKTS